MPARKTGSEPFCTNGGPLPQTVCDFWRWAFSDLTGNALRGLVAEYLVAVAVGADAGVRVEWEAFDVRAPSGARIEVKASGYVQSWNQTKPSDIRFDIAPKKPLEEATNSYPAVADPRRHADIYVFALHRHQDKATADPLNVEQWEFYVLSTRALDAHCPTQRSLGLTTLQRLGAVSVPYAQLAKAIELAAS